MDQVVIGPRSAALGWKPGRPRFPEAAKAAFQEWKRSLLTPERIPARRLSARRYGARRISSIVIIGCVAPVKFWMLSRLIDAG